MTHFGIVLGLVFSVAVQAGAASSRGTFEPEGAYLDPAYKDLSLSRMAPEATSSQTQRSPFAAKKSDTLALIAKQTPVRAQLARGTCSIFSAIGILEGMLNVNGQVPQDGEKTWDLSEEFLEFVVHKDGSGEGSTSTGNFRAFTKFGATTESLMPYIGETWEAQDQTTMSQDRCGKVPADQLSVCLIGHRDPRLWDQTDAELADPQSSFYDLDFLAARTHAESFLNQYIKGHVQGVGGYSVSSAKKVKQKLLAGTPVNLDLSFYYGAWNHRKAPEFGINRDMGNWDKGIVGYPEAGSMDRKKSEENSAGHSIVVVGYDDEKEVVTHSLMEDGTTKEFHYKGVYYFKNSWGTDKFGKDFVLDGQAHPGYGMITQKYAEEKGAFFELPLSF